jgi:hypothetical protein
MTNVYIYENFEISFVSFEQNMKNKSQFKVGFYHELIQRQINLIFGFVSNSLKVVVGWQSCWFPNYKTRVSNLHPNNSSVDCSLIS